MKHHRNKINFIFIPFLIVLLSSIKTSACDCIMSPIEKYIDTSQYIIVAKVKKIINESGQDNYGYRAILAVTKIYKSGIQKGELIEIDSDQSDCSFKFELNKNYFLFCYLNGTKFFVPYCSYSEQLKYSRKSINRVKKYLKNLACLRVYQTDAKLGLRKGELAHYA